MAENKKTPKLINGIGISELRDILSKSVYTEREREHIISIFNELSFENNVLSGQEWNAFANRIDLNKDGNLSEYEQRKIYPSSGLPDVSGRKGLYLTRDDVLNFYNLLSKYIEENGGEIPPKVANTLEYCKNKFNITDIHSDALSTYVKFDEADGSSSVMEYDNDNGKEIREILIDKDGFIEYVVTYGHYDYFVEVEESGDMYQHSDYFERSKPKNTKTMVFSSRLNPHRYGQCDRDFTGNWLYEDRHRSKTFEEFLENLKKDEVQYDEKAAEELTNAAMKTSHSFKYRGNCARHVFDVLGSVKNYLGEKLSTGMEPKHAYQNALQLSESDNFREVPYNIVSTMNLNQLPKGCIIVYDGFYKYSPKRRSDVKKYHEYGHIAITEGSEYAHGGGRYPIYDRLVTGRQKTHIRVFVPVKLYEVPVKPLPPLPEQKNYRIDSFDREKLIASLKKNTKNFVD